MISLLKRSNKQPVLLMAQEKRMTNISQNSRYGTIKTILVSILTPSFIITAIAAFFIWLFLYRIGRQDIFLEIISFKEIFNFISFCSLLSTLLFCLVFFTPSIIPPMIFFTSMKNYSDYKKIEKGYRLVLGAGSLIAAAIFYGGTYYFTKRGMGVGKWPFAIVFFTLNITVCIILNLIFNRKVVSLRSHILSGWDWLEFVFVINIFKPAMLGLVSCLFVFPLGILIKTLKFPKGTGDLTEALILCGLTFLIIILSLLPFMILSEMKASILKKLTVFISVTFLTLILISSFLPVIPVMIMNMTMKLSGVMDLTIYRYAVPVEKYPAEMFEGKRWALAESKDKKFHTFEGVNLFSLGSISLICPKNIPRVLKESMFYQLGDAQFDNSLREKLQQETKKCNVLNKEVLLKWQE